PADIAIRRGDFAFADSVLGEAKRRRDQLLQFRARWFSASSLRAQGRMREAMVEADWMRRAPPGLGEPVPVNAFPRALVLLESGRASEAAALFDSLAAYPHQPLSPALTARGRAWTLTHSATARAVAGDTSSLAAIVDTLEALAQRSRFARDRYLPHYVRGLLLAARGRPAEAAEEYRRASYSQTSGYARVNFHLAQVLLALKRPREAIAVLEPPCRGPVEVGGMYVTKTELHALLARAFEAAGQPDSAAAHYRWVLNAWKNADPIFHARRDSVRARMEALTGRR
ncbi:MAG: tetratricopeptide repeat protein, partial [Gemmatimonadales bacterium]